MGKLAKWADTSAEASAISIRIFHLLPLSENDCLAFAFE